MLVDHASRSFIFPILILPLISSLPYPSFLCVPSRGCSDLAMEYGELCDPLPCGSGRQTGFLLLSEWKITFSVIALWISKVFKQLCIHYATYRHGVTPNGFEPTKECRYCSISSHTDLLPALHRKHHRSV